MNISAILAPIHAKDGDLGLKSYFLKRDFKSIVRELGIPGKTSPGQRGDSYTYWFSREDGHTCMVVLYVQDGVVTNTVIQ